MFRNGRFVLKTKLCMSQTESYSNFFQTTQKCQNMAQTFEVRTYGGFTLRKASQQIILGGFNGSNSLFKSPINQTAKPDPIKEACKHIVVPLSIVIGKTECLAISCDRCQYIKLAEKWRRF